MSNNQAKRGSVNQLPVKRRVHSTYTKDKDNYKTRDKPKYKSGSKPKNNARDRGIDNPRRRTNSYSSKNKSNYRSRENTSNRDYGSSQRSTNTRSRDRSGERSRSSDRTGNRSRQDFRAICSSCNKETTLPFKPTGSKPVYCRECFQDHKPRDRDSDRTRRRPSDRSGGKLEYPSGDRQRRRYDDRTRTRADGHNFDAICSACGKPTTLPFKPTGVKPVFFRDCFKKQGNQETAVQDKELVERFGDRKGPYRANKRMHQTNCRECNELILIPFKPTKNKLIYCPDCYEKNTKKEVIK